MANLELATNFSFSQAETNSRAGALGLCDGLMSRFEMPVTSTPIGLTASAGS